MSLGRHAPADKQNSKSRGSASKMILLFLALVLVIGVAAGGTIAWLMADTTPVVNTFTYGEIVIELEETDPEQDDDPNNNTYEMFPGSDITKDPHVIVKAGNEACWLFVKIETSDNFDDFLTYTVDGEWTQLLDEDEMPVPGVWFRPVDEDRDSQDKEYPVLAGDKVSTRAEVTREQLEEITDSEEYPTMTLTAYAVQRELIDSAYEAWTLMQEEDTD